jgi:hypothetical protein
MANIAHKFIFTCIKCVLQGGGGRLLILSFISNSVSLHGYPETCTRLMGALFLNYNLKNNRHFSCICYLSLSHYGSCDLLL